MNEFIGVKRVLAKPKTRLEYNQLRGWELPEDENGDDKGMLVENIAAGKPNHPGFDGYISWSPMDVFEREFTPVSEGTKLSLGLAVEAAKQGARIAREGWNGKGMFVVYQKGYPEGIPCNKQSAEAWGMEEGDFFRCEPYLQIQMVNGSHSMWAPSINDTLAEDWVVLDD